MPLRLGLTIKCFGTEVSPNNSARISLVRTSRVALPGVKERRSVLRVSGSRGELSRSQQAILTFLFCFSSEGLIYFHRYEPSVSL